MVHVTSIAIQGRHDISKHEDWVTVFQVAYNKQGRSWLYFKDQEGYVQVFIYNIISSYCNIIIIDAFYNKNYLFSNKYKSDYLHNELQKKCLLVTTSIRIFNLSSVLNSTEHIQFPKFVTNITYSWVYKTSPSHLVTNHPQLTVLTLNLIA